MNARLYDAKLHRFLAPDNFVQDPYNTQNYNRYSYVLNNPVSFVDPSGENPVLVAALIGAAVSVLTNGITNSIHHQPFFNGAIQAGIMGVYSGAISFGIGSAASGISSSVGKFAFQTVAHGVLGGTMTMLNGGQFGHGFVAGAVGSMAGYGAGKLLGGVNNVYLQAGGIVLAGGVSGGVASVAAGGKFWDGFRNGLISAGLNHAAHYMVGIYTINKVLKEMDLRVMKG